MSSTCYFCHLNLGWHGAAGHGAQQISASSCCRQTGPQGLEPGCYRAHSACSKEEAPACSKSYGGLSAVDQSCGKLLFLFALFFSSLVTGGGTEAPSKELIRQKQKLSSSALHGTSQGSGDHSAGQELRHVSLPFSTLSTCSSQV